MLSMSSSNTGLNRLEINHLYSSWHPNSILILLVGNKNMVFRLVYEIIINSQTNIINNTLPKIQDVLTVDTRLVFEFFLARMLD